MKEIEAMECWSTGVLGLLFRPLLQYSITPNSDPHTGANYGRL
jgi:hypothetical protein